MTQRADYNIIDHVEDADFASLTTELISPKDFSEIEPFLAEKTPNTLYQNPLWLRALSKGFGFRTQYLVWRHSGRICAVLPLAWSRKRWTRRAISLPFTYMLEARCSEGVLGDHAWQLAWSTIQKAGGRSWVVKDSVPGGTALGGQYVRSVVNLTQPLTAVRAGYSSSARRALRKAKNSGVEVRAWTKADATICADMIWTNHRLHGVPTYPRNFVRVLFDDLLSRGHALGWLAWAHDKPLGVMIFFPGDTWTYAYGASVTDSEAMRLRPNNLLMDHGIATAHTAGAHALDLGISPLGNKGLRRFKQQWGSNETPVVYTTFGQGRTIKREGLAATVLRATLPRLPSPLYTGVSEALIRLVE